MLSVYSQDESVDEPPLLFLVSPFFFFSLSFRRSIRLDFNHYSIVTALSDRVARLFYYMVSR